MNHFPENESLLEGVENDAVRAAFNQTDRSLFVLPKDQPHAWADHPLPIEDGATISQPSLVAKMTEWLDLTADSRALEIGTGSGYQTALLAELAAEVYTIEISKQLSESAQRRLQSLNFSNIYFRNGDGSHGWPEAALFDRIIATVAFRERPTQLLEQLSAGGICLVPVGPPKRTQQLKLYKKTDTQITEQNLCPVRFLSLRVTE